MYVGVSRILHWFLPHRTLAESSIRDEAGRLTVGGVSGAVDGFFIGILQDVRVYAASLDQRSVLVSLSLSVFLSVSLCLCLCLAVCVCLPLSF